MRSPCPVDALSLTILSTEYYDSPWIPKLMKVCAYCGLENDDAALQYRHCRMDDFKNSAQPAAPSSAPSSTPTKLEFVPMKPEERDHDLVTLLRCRTLLEADLIVAQLESAGISAFIPDQFLMQAISWNVNTYGYVRIQVPPKDYEAAKEFLQADIVEP
jgi:hypothetical protein